MNVPSEGKSRGSKNDRTHLMFWVSSKESRAWNGVNKEIKVDDEVRDVAGAGHERFYRPL